MKFTILARGQSSLENGSFIKVYSNKKREMSRFINGDYMGAIENEETRKEIDLKLVSGELKTYTWKEAKPFLPACNK